MRNFIGFFFMFLLGGCASIGGKVSELSFEGQEVPADATRSIGEVSVSSGSSASVNESVGAFNWGDYSLQDEILLEHAIRTAMGRIPDGGDSSPVGIGVKIHRFSQVITNQSYASLVIVDWCMYDNAGVFFSEVFYAGHANELLIFSGKTLGWAKEKTMQAIANRIVNESTRQVSRSGTGAGLDAGDTYLDADEILALLPDEMHSVGTRDSGNPLLGVTSHDGKTRFDEKLQFEPVDWESWLEERRRRGSH